MFLTDQDPYYIHKKTAVFFKLFFKDVYSLDVLLFICVFIFTGYLRRSVVYLFICLYLQVTSDVLQFVLVHVRSHQCR